MAGEKRKKSPAGSSVSRRGSRNRTRGSAPRRAATGNRERRNASRASKARVIQFPQGRRPRRSRLPDRRKVGSAGGRGRVRLIMGAVVVVCVSLSLEGRAVQLSVAKDDRYQAFTTEANAEERSGAATSSERTGRGSIVSADGRYLAMSLDTAKVIATPYQVEEPEEAAEALSEVLGEDAGTTTEIEEKLVEKNGEDGPSGYSVVAEDVEPETAREVNRLGLSGISTAPDERRVYPSGALASQLVGYLGTDKAYGGVEARYDDLLESGKEVRLTLDTAVQQELEGALLQTAEEYEGKSALGLLMRVEDGAVVALAHTPGYDNNEFGEASAEAKRSRVLTDPHEPGSTFKAFTMAAAIEEKAVNEESTFVVADSIPVADVLIHDSEPHETKVMNTTNILEHSSNVGTIQVAQLLGGERLVEHIERFGFGEGTGVDLWGEDPGRVPPFEEWSGSSIGNIPVGQGLSVTPLQLAAGYVSLANGGLKVTPHVAEQAAPDEPGRRVISKETSSIVRGMLQSVVDEGTGHLAQIPGYTVAGKTGTAQKVDPETGLYGDEYVTSFVGFAPAFQDVMGFTLGYFNVSLDRESTKADPPPPDPTPAPDARKEDRIR